MKMSQSLSRRRTFAYLGAGGMGVSLATAGLTARAQEATPAALIGTVPPDLESWVSGWEAQDAEQIASTYAEDALVELVPFSILLNGREAIQEYFSAYFGAFDASTATITTAFATDDQAGAEWVFQGQYTGQLPGLPPGDGQPVIARGANIMTLRDGQIAEERIYTDLAGLLGQIGMMDATVPGTPVATPAG